MFTFYSVSFWYTVKKIYVTNHWPQAASWLHSHRKLEL